MLFKYKSKQPWEHVNSYSSELEFRLVWNGVFEKCKKDTTQLLRSIEQLYYLLIGIRIDDLCDTDLIKEHINPLY